MGAPTWPPNPHTLRAPRLRWDALHSQLHTGALLLERRRFDAVLIAPATIHRLQQLHLTEVEQARGHAVLCREISGQPEVLVRERQREPRGEVAAEQRGRHALREGHVLAHDAALAERL